MFTIDQLTPYVITGLLTFVAGWALRYVGPRARLVWWGQEFYYDMEINKGQPRIALYTHSISIQNVGRKTAEQVEVAHQWRPDHFKLEPPLNFEDIVSPDGTHIIRVTSLAPREYVTVNCLSYKSTPKFLYVHSKDGNAVGITIQRQRVFPKWLQLLVAIILFVGLGTILYWTFNAVISLLS